MMGTAAVSPLLMSCADKDRTQAGDSAQYIACVSKSEGLLGFEKKKHYH